jgi:hypothetical protein
MGIGSFSQKIKRPGREADYSPPSIAEVNNGGAIPPLPDNLTQGQLYVRAGIAQSV